MRFLMAVGDGSRAGCCCQSAVAMAALDAGRLPDPAFVLRGQDRRGVVLREELPAAADRRSPGGRVGRQRDHGALTRRPSRRTCFDDDGPPGGVSGAVAVPAGCRFSCGLRTLPPGVATVENDRTARVRERQTLTQSRRPRTAGQPRGAVHRVFRQGRRLPRPLLERLPRRRPQSCRWRGRRLSLATHALRDELVLVGLLWRRPLRRQRPPERSTGGAREAVDFYRRKGWLEKPGDFFPARPLRPTSPSGRSAIAAAPTSADHASGYEPHPREPVPNAG